MPDQLSGRAEKVPCIGGVSAWTLLELTAQAKGKRTFVDRGWCNTCPAGSDTAGSVFEAIEEASGLLSELGVPACWHPEVIREYIPVKFARPVDASAQDSHVSRRGFIGAFMRKAVETAERSTAPPVHLAADRGACKPSLVIQTQQIKRAASLRKLASLHGRLVPAALFPHLEIIRNCNHNGLCTAVCPTGALRGYAERGGEVVGLEFEADICIGCGLCTSQCPNQAVRVLPNSNAEAQALPGATKVTRHEKRACSRCATHFLSVGSASTQCPRCQIDQTLARSLFGRPPSVEVAQAPEMRNLLSSNFTAL